MKKLPAIVFMLLFATVLVLADGDKKPFVRFAKGNFWKYDVVERKKKKPGKVEVAEIDKDGAIKVKLTGMDGPADEMVWRMEKDCLVWEIEKGLKWKVLKFGAKKNDSWTSEVRPPGLGPGADSPAEMVLKSTVVAVEDVETPAGKIKGCLKVQTMAMGEAGGPEVIVMWWAQGVGLVSLQVMRGGELRDSWTLTSYRVGHDISDEKLKEMVEKSDVVAYVTIPKEGAGARKVQVKLSGLYKGEPKEDEGDIVIMQPREGGAAGAFEPGDFVVFLKQEGETLVLLYGAARADRDMLDRLAGIVTPEGQTPGKLKELCEKAQIIAGVEIVVLEDRGSFKYYVVKVISAAKGAQGRKYLDVLSTGLSVKKGGKYILFLVNTEEHGRTMTRLVDTIKGVLDYDEALLARLAELSKGSR